jgi:tetratricopeptide (TPR) repeat protein
MTPTRRDRASSILLWLPLVGLMACAEPQPTTPGTGGAPPAAGAVKPAVVAPPKPNLADWTPAVRDQAKALEAAGELRPAFVRWQFVNQLVPNDAEARQMVESLRSRLETEAKQHFDSATAFHQKEETRQKALKEYLLTLSYDPANRPAFEAVKFLVGAEFTIHEVKAGDTLETISQEEYNDPELDYLITYFNDLPEGGRLTAGAKLQLPVLIVVQKRLAAQADAKVGSRLAEAQARLNAKDYPEAISIAERILSQIPNHAEARQLLNAALYERGKGLSVDKKYVEALSLLNRVEPTYKDTRSLIQSVRRAMREQAEFHFANGVKSWTNEDLDGAIKEWEATLSLNPEHAKAKESISEAKKMQAALKRYK